MHFRGKIIAALLGGAALAAPAMATTLQDAFVQTYNTSPALAAARAQLRGTDEGVSIAKAGSRLQVNGTVGLSQSTNGIDNFSNGARVLTAQANLSYPLFQGGRVKNSINAAQSRVAAGRADLRTTEGNLFVQVVSAYMDVIRDASIVDLNRKNVDVLNTNLKASRDRFAVGDLTRTDVAQSEARLSLARSQLITAQGNLTASRENYRRVVGSWPENLAPPPALPKLPADPDQAVTTALDNSPAIQAAAADTKAAEFDVRSARSQRLPTLSAIAGPNYNNFLGAAYRAAGIPKDSPAAGSLPNSQSANTFGVQMSVPLYQGGLAGARVRQAQAAQNVAQESGIDTERQVIANTRGAFAAYQAAAAAIGANQEAVKANELALEGVRAENRVGTRTVLDVLNAEQELLNSQVDLVSAQHDNYVAGFALLNAMGMAEARDLGLDGGSLYDPTANYNRVKGWIGDWSEQPKYAPKGTHTTGPTPTDPDVTPYNPDDGNGAVTPPQQ